MTTAHLIIKSSRSFDRPINIRVPERPVLADNIISMLISFTSYSFVYSVYLGYEPEGSRLNIISFFRFVYLAIRTLGTLPRT